MAKTEVGGISGVLGELVSKEPVFDESPLKSEPRALTEKCNPDPMPETPSPPKASRARLGRPPGAGLRQSGPKEKVTLRIPSKLIAEYRDWSWEARCQLSELVERALVAYRRTRRGS